MKYDEYKDELPMFRRSREGAWIEMRATIIKLESGEEVAPARERGLKYVNAKYI